MSCKFEYVYSGHDVVNGLFNMTSQLLQYKLAEPTTPEDKSTREDALRFFVHFMGDVHQPLHASGKERGGNDAPAKWGRAKTSLHRIWDGQLILVSPLVKKKMIRVSRLFGAYLKLISQVTHITHTHACYVIVYVSYRKTSRTDSTTTPRHIWITWST